MPEAYCLMFAGQSVQQSGMCRELWRLPAARAILEKLKPSLGADIERVTTEMGEEELALTYNAQRAIHAHHLGHWFAYRARHPEIVLDGALGHSMGVVAALVAAGSLGVEDSGAFIRARAKSFARACRSFGAPMGLAAVSTEEFPDLLETLQEFPGVRLALRNTLRSGVLGGTLADLQALARRAEEEDWPVRLRLLKVEGPYHTPAFAPCREDLRRALEGIEIRPPRVRVFMGTSGRLETDPKRIRELLVEQADSPERHLEAVQAAYAHGCRRFLEVSYKPQPVTWLKDQLQGPDGGPAPAVTAAAVRTPEIS